MNEGAREGRTYKTTSRDTSPSFKICQTLAAIYPGRTQVQCTFHLVVEVRNALHALAWQRGVTMSALVNDLILREVEREMTTDGTVSG